jgi:hypothetical protein
MLRTIIAGLLSSCCAAGLAAQPAALVLETTTRVEVRRLAYDGRVAAATGLRLHSGDSIFIPRGASLTLLLRSGRVQRLGADFVVPVTASAPADGAARSAFQAAPARREGAGYFRPAGTGPVPTAPRNDVAVQPGVVAFHWHPTAGSARYVVQIRRTDVPGFVRFRVGPDTTWTPEPGALEPGVTYEWAVLTDGAVRPGAPVSFRVIGDAAWQAVQEEIAALTELSLTQPAQLLLEALAYRAAGLLYDAARRFAALAATGTQLSAETLELYADVLEALGDDSGAARIRQG